MVDDLLTNKDKMLDFKKAYILRTSSYNALNAPYTLL